MTVGHSTLSAGEFLALLQSRGIETLADVRRYPASRRHPHFGDDALRASLAQAGIGYTHLPRLGGRRETHADSPNTGWPPSAFRGYADHMATQEFRDALDCVVESAAGRRTVVMCAEKNWRHCHRGLIADALKVAGHDVVHIVDEELDEIHPYTKPARILDGRLSYRADPPMQSALDF